MGLISSCCRDEISSLDREKLKPVLDGIFVQQKFTSKTSYSRMYVWINLKAGATRPTASAACAPVTHGWSWLLSEGMELALIRQHQTPQRSSLETACSLPATGTQCFSSSSTSAHGRTSRLS